MHTGICRARLPDSTLHSCVYTRGYHLQSGDVCTRSKHPALAGLRVYTHANMPTRSVARA